MNIVEELSRTKEQLLEKKKAAQSICNAPMMAQYQILLDAIDKNIAEAKAGK